MYYIIQKVSELRCSTLSRLSGRVPADLPGHLRRAAEDLRRARGGRLRQGDAGQPAGRRPGGLPPGGRQAAVHRQDGGGPAVHQPRWGGRRSHMLCAREKKNITISITLSAATPYQEVFVVTLIISRWWKMNFLLFCNILCIVIFSFWINSDVSWKYEGESLWWLFENCLFALAELEKTCWDQTKYFVSLYL